NVFPISGDVFVDGVPLPQAKQVPFGSILDSRNGIVAITPVGPNGQLQTAYLFGGIFKLVQGADGATEFQLVEGDFSVCTVKTTKAATAKSKKTNAKTKAKTRTTQAAVAKPKPAAKKPQPTK